MAWRYGDAEKPDEFVYEQALQSFDDYVLKFEELWEKYESDPDRDQKIAAELGSTLVHDDGEEDELTSEEPNHEIEVAPTESPEPLWWRDPLIIRAKDLCVAVSEFGQAGTLDLAASRRVERIQLR